MFLNALMVKNLPQGAQSYSQGSQGTFSRVSSYKHKTLDFQSVNGLCIKVYDAYHK